MVRTRSGNSKDDQQTCSHEDRGDKRKDVIGNGSGDTVGCNGTAARYRNGSAIRQKPTQPHDSNDHVKVQIITIFFSNY